MTADDPTPQSAITTREQARARGLDRYYTGKPCKHGHITERRTSDSHCIECAAIRSNENGRRWRIARPDRVLEISRQWRNRNRIAEPLYETWRGMIARTTNPKHKDWSSYGGRGIKVCDRWRYGENGKSGYKCFLEDVGSRPSPQHSLDRYPNPDGNYKPGNVRWATSEQQAHNRRARHHRICQGCGASFVSIYSSTQFCSKRCYRRAYHRRNGRETQTHNIVRPV